MSLRQWIRKYITAPKIVAVEEAMKGWSAGFIRGLEEGKRMSENDGWDDEYVEPQWLDDFEQYNQNEADDYRNEGREEESLAPCPVCRTQTDEQCGHLIESLFDQPIGTRIWMFRAEEEEQFWHGKVERTIIGPFYDTVVVQWDDGTETVFDGTEQAYVVVEWRA